MVQLSKAGMKSTLSLKAGHPPAGISSYFNVIKVSECFVFGLAILFRRVLK